MSCTNNTAIMDALLLGFCPTAGCDTFPRKVKHGIQAFEFRFILGMQQSLSGIPCDLSFIKTAITTNEPQNFMPFSLQSADQFFTNQACRTGYQNPHCPYLPNRYTACAFDYTGY